MTSPAKPSTPPATSASGPEPGAEAGKPAEKRLWLRGPARHAATIALGAVFLVNILLVLRMLLAQPEVPDTTARVRPDGTAIAVYDAPAGGERIHLLQPGSVIDLGSPALMPGSSRFFAHIRVDAMVIEGFVESKDVVPEDVERVRRVYESRR